MRISRRVLAAAAALLVLTALNTGARATPAATHENVRFITNVPGPTGGHVVVEGNRLYMGNYGTGLSAYDISDPAHPARLGQYLPGPSTNDGADPGVRADAPPDAAIWDGRHIVSLGGTNRFANRIQTEFIDFTNPASPRLLWRFPSAPDAESHNGDIVDARKLWLPSGGGNTNGLRIYGLSPILQDPPTAPVKLFSGNPHALWQASPYREFYGKPVGGSFNHTHDIEIYVDRTILLPEWEWVDQNGDGTPDPTHGNRDIALLAAAGGGNTSGAVYVIDITDPTAPVVISKWQNPAGAAHNPIGYLHEAQFLHGDPNTIFVADEDLTSGCNEGRLYTVGISDDLIHVTKLGEWAIGAGAQDSPLCMGSHVFSSNDRHVFMGSYVAGLQVVDLRDPAQPKRAGRYIAEGANSWGALYHKGYVYVGDFGGRGLDVFEFIPNPHAQGLLKVNNPGTRSTSGVAEAGCEVLQDPYGPTNGTDGLIVPIPEDKRDGTHKIRAVGSSSGAPYDLDIWFHDEACVGLSGTGLASDSPDEFGPIPEGAAFASIDLYTGPPTYAYVQIDP
ncbi:MAG: LVIVD repeat-containing protein [Actinomycetota bacterium]